MTRQTKGLLWLVAGFALTLLWIILLATGIPFYIFLPLALLAGMMKGEGLSLIFSSLRNRRNTLQ